MAAKFTPKIRTLVASSLIDVLSQQQILEWQQLTPYLEGDLVYYGSNKYICKDGGTSGTIPPSHSNGSDTDGGLDWIWVEAMSSTQMFKHNMFVSIGKKEEWADELVPDDTEIHDISDADVIKNIISLKKVSGSNFRLAIKRYDWTSGTVYSQYDSLNDPLAIDGTDYYEHPYYIFTDENKIYKCLNNNNDSPSTSKPTSIGTNISYLADGYCWKFMGALDSDSVNFLTKDFIPVKYKISNDASGQWDVQQAAVQESISTFKILNKRGIFPTTTVVTVSGGTPTTPAQAFTTKNVDDTLNQILVDPSNVGEGYDLNSEVLAFVQRSGVTGSGGTIDTITISQPAGTITDISIDDAGVDYSSGAILILYDPNGGVTLEADIDVVITPGNNLQEFSIVDGGLGYSADTVGYIIPGSAGAIGKAVFAPKEGHGFNIVTELCANTCIINTRFSEETDYFPIGESNAFRQVSLITDLVEKDTFNPASNIQYLGPAHPSYGSLILNNIDSNKGYVLYVNNIRKVIRDNGQEEDIKLAISF